MSCDLKGRVVMKKRKFSRSCSRDFFLDAPLSSKPPGIDHPRFDYFLGEATAFMKAVVSGASVRSLRKLEHMMDPLSVEIARWLFSELRHAVTVAETVRSGTVH